MAAGSEQGAAVDLEPLADSSMDLPGRAAKGRCGAAHCCTGGTFFHIY
jgi:hypothetical protein